MHPENTTVYRESERVMTNNNGRFGKYGGMYVPELLVAPIKALIAAYNDLSSDKVFMDSFNHTLEVYAGRPTPLTPIKRFSQAIGGPNIFLKREDLLHTGAHKINNALGQCLLAQKMGKRRIIAETGAGQHGVATAAACAYLGLDCVVYMGSIDAERQSPNVARMKLLGAKVIYVEKGSKTLKDAVNEALRDWASSYDDTHYCLGSALGPHPFPAMVELFQSVIGKEVKQQSQSLISKNPDMIIACVGGGSNAIGIFSSFLDDDVELIGVEAGGTGDKLGQHAARFQCGKPGILHGCFSYLLQDEHGQVFDTHSISAGLDYPSVGPHHAELHDSKRVFYTSVTDDEVINAFKLLSRTEGIIPALESSHALAYIIKTADKIDPMKNVIINLSGRGDKDLPQFFSENLLDDLA